MNIRNSARITFQSRSINEAFARSVIGGFCSQLDPTIEQLADVKTAVSEAVTNSIIHGYPDTFGVITMKMEIIEPGILKITISDKGIGIENINQAMMPMFTTGNSEERAGLGFAVMETFMDKLKVYSRPGKSTRVVMQKRIITI